SGLQVQEDAAHPLQIEVVLDWQALDRPTNDYTAFVHLVGRDQDILAQYDQPPGGGDNPTHLWAPKEVVRSVFPLKLPAGVDLAGASLRIGLYDPLTSDRLPIVGLATDQASVPDGTYLLVPLRAGM
ncbi:MAG: hypothetical protein KDI55_26715, partial [Anaerolineae bacterium]|nr:hypothetical protein [Anaerolineae bacterium]